MKRINPFLLLFMLPLFFTTCEKTDDGSFVEPITLYEKLPGTWNLSSLKMVDEIAKANSLDPYEFDIKSEFGFNDYAITLNIDSSFQPTTFDVACDCPELFLKNGYWALDNPFIHTDGTPSELNLYSDEAKTQLVDVLSITTLPGARAELEFKLQRISEGTPYVSYIYKFRLAK